MRRISSKVLYAVSILLIIGLTSLASFGFGYNPFKNQATELQIDETVTQEPVSKDIVVNGKVINYITKQPLENIAVSAGEATAKTNDQGLFSLSIKEGSQDPITVMNDQYNTVTVKIDNAAAIELVPAGRTIFVSNRDGARRIYSSDYAGKEQTQLVKSVSETEDFSPLVSPYDKLVAFLSSRNKRLDKYNNYQPSLYLTRVDGSNLQKVSDFYHTGEIKWSPEGSYLAWKGQEKEDSEDQKLAIRNLLTGATIYNGDPGERVGTYAFSLDDSKTAFTITSSSDVERRGLYISDGSGENPRKISDELPHFLEFNQDGNIEFTVYREGQKKYVWFHDSGAIKEQSTSPVIRNIFAVTKSPDGKQIAYVDNRDGKRDLFIANLDKSNEKRLTPIGTVTGSVRFSQDGKYILFDVSKEAESARYIVSASGSAPAQKIVDIHQVGGYGY